MIMGKSLGGARLSMPMMELMLHAVEGVRVLCEEVVLGGEVMIVWEEFLTVQNLDVGRTYSSWQCMQLVLNCLPLLNHLFTLIVASFKKIQAHVSVDCSFSDMHV